VRKDLFTFAVYLSVYNPETKESHSVRDYQCEVVNE
jgi:hypothetical protein